jgi:predicted nucleotide-binding protein
MAKRADSSPPSRGLSTDEKRAALTRLEARIKEIEQLDTSRLQRGDDASVQSLEARIKSTLASIFGEASAEYRRLRLASDLDATAYVLSFDGYQTPSHEIRQGVERGKERSIALLQGETDALRESLAFSAPTPTIPGAAPAVITDDIFVVHGRDEAAKTEVAHFIERAGLKAVILHQQPNEGKTIIEKFEKHGGASGFAVVIVTPDDVGGLNANDLKPRARQNVIGEMFWFAGGLGRDRVCALIKGEIEMPSDVAGVGYTPMDAHGDWRTKLLQELDAAGYKNLDWKKALA